MVILKKPSEIEVIAEGGRKLARILAALCSEVQPGAVTKELELSARKLIAQAGATPAFLGYRSAGDRAPYPCALCVSVNETVVHGLPSSRALAPGDIVKIDLGLKFKGYYVDAAVTVGAGNVSPRARELIETTKKALERGVEAARVGRTLGDIGHAVENCVRKKRCAVVESLVGHGIGRELHEEPVVWNKGRLGTGMRLEEGMVLAIEPMVSAGSGKVVRRADGSFAAKDKSLTAHFEHTVAITKRGPRVLTAAA